MKSLLALAAAAALAAGCATTDAPVQVAKAECKVHPVVTTSATSVGKPRPSSAIEQRWAQAQLATSQYRQQNLAAQGLFHNNVEDAINDCP